MGSRSQWCLLSITTYAGFAPGAKHFYGRLEYGWQAKEVEKHMPDGSTIRQFNTKDAVIRVAIDQYRNVFPEAKGLQNYITEDVYHEKKMSDGGEDE